MNVADIPAALARYEAARRPHTAKVQRISWDDNTFYHVPDGPQQAAWDEALQGAATESGLATCVGYMETTQRSSPNDRHRKLTRESFGQMMPVYAEPLTDRHRRIRARSHFSKLTERERTLAFEARRSVRRGHPPPSVG
jgi:hypothetical protein